MFDGMWLEKSGMLESSSHGVPKEQWQRKTVLFSELLLSTPKRTLLKQVGEQALDWNRESPRGVLTQFSYPSIKKKMSLKDAWPLNIIIM